MLFEFVVLGVLGGVTRALIQARRLADLGRFSIAKAILLGPVAGTLYFYMYMDWGAPNHAITFFFSYAFVDIVDRLARLIIEVGKSKMRV